MPKFEVVRTIEIGADPQQVYDRIANFDSWTSWSPWLCCEPEAKVTVTDEAASVGSVYAWDGEVVGQGEIEHEVLEPAKRIESQLRFFKPWKSQAATHFRIDPAATGSRLTWTMQGALPWFMFWMTEQMKSQIGMDYDRGLKMLKDLMESGSIPSQVDIKGVVEIGPIYVAGVRRQTTFANIHDSMEEAFTTAGEKVPAAGVDELHEMVSVYHKTDMKRGELEYTAGFVLPKAAPAGTGLSCWSMPQGRAFRVDHIGEYKHLGNAWSAAYMQVEGKKLKRAKGGTFEIYKNDPRETPPAEWLTEIYLPLK